MKQSGWLVLGCSLLLARSGRADDFHYETFRYGQRAMGMGGAVVAYPGEPEQSFYNPAGIAAIDRTLLSGALEFYGIDRRIKRRSFRAGSWFPPADETSEGVLVLPSSSVLTYPVGEGQTLALSTFLYSGTDELFSGEKTAPFSDALGNSQIRYTSSVTTSDRIVHGGVSYARRLMEGLSLGVSAFYARRDQKSTVKRVQAREFTNQAQTFYTDIGTYSEVTDGALFLRAGLHSRPHAALSLGLACSTPSLAIHGQGKLGYSLVASGGNTGTDISPPPMLRTQEYQVQARTLYPWNCRVGVAFQPSPSFTLSGDLSVHGSTSYDRLSLDSTLAAEPSVRAAPTNHIERQAVVNAALGMEWYPYRAMPIRVGAFTNRSAAPHVPAQPTSLQYPDVDLYGGTLSVGYFDGKHTFNLGVEVQAGTGRDVTIESLRTLLADGQYATIDREQLRAVLFLSGVLDFTAEVTLQLPNAIPGVQVDTEALREAADQVERAKRLVPGVKLPETKLPDINLPGPGVPDVKGPVPKASEPKPPDPKPPLPTRPLEAPKTPNPPPAG